VPNGDDPGYTPLYPIEKTIRYYYHFPIREFGKFG
jgi:hypothetical protein